MPQKKEQKSKWASALKIIAWLTVISFLISFVVSLFIGEDFEDISGNVAVIGIKGTIVVQDSGNFLFEEMTSSGEIRKLIQKAKKNDAIKAIVFDIDSPGGSAVASEEIANEIKKANKSTVAWVREIGTSGAYWAASATDHIIANRMSITGSIGVIASYLGFAGFLEEHNVTYERLISGDLKDIGSPFKGMTKEEKILFQKSLDAIKSHFVDEIAKNRKLSRKDAERLATGQFYLGAEAKELGLVDELGGRDEVIAYLQAQIGEEPRLIEYKSDRGFFSSWATALNKNSFYIGKGIGSALISRASMPSSLVINT